MRNRDMPSKPCHEDKSRANMFSVGGDEKPSLCAPKPLGFIGLTKLEYAAIELFGAIIIGNDADDCATGIGAAKDAIAAANALFDELEKSE